MEAHSRATVSISTEPEEGCIHVERLDARLEDLLSSGAAFPGRRHWRAGESRGNVFTTGARWTT